MYYCLPLEKYQNLVSAVHKFLSACGQIPPLTLLPEYEPVKAPVIYSFKLND